MKRCISASSIVFLLLLGSSESFSQQGRGQGVRGRTYNPATVETISGRIDEVVFVKGGRGRSAQGVHLALSTTGGSIEAHLGPASFVDGKMTFAKGDTVMIVGSRMTMGGRDAIIAKTVTKGGTVLTLRNDDGTPLWAGFYGPGRGRGRQGR